MSDFWKGKRVFVTGAEGFIGSHLTESLVNAGADVRAFVFYNSFGKWGWLDDLSEEQKSQIDIMTGDIRDQDKMISAVEGRDYVFHLASLISIPYSYEAPESYVDTNIKGTLSVLNACRKHDVKRMIHTSTSEVYGTAQYVPIDEEHPLQPQSPYSATKIAADSLAISYYCSFNLPVSILRPFNTFGPRQSARAVIPTIISQIYFGKKTIELGNVTPTRDFNYVSNTVDGFLKLAQASDVDGEAFNVGSEREISIRDLVELIIKISGKKVEITNDKERYRPDKSEVQRLLSNSTKMRKKCGYEPRVSLEEGIEATCKWIQDNLHTFKPEVYSK